MVKPTTSADIELDVVGGGLDKALDHVEARVRAITILVAKAGTEAAKSADSVNVQFNTQIKALQGQLGQLSTLQKTIQNTVKAGQLGVNNAVADQAFARRTLQATTYAKTLKNSVDLQEALTARLNTFEKQNAAIGSRNEILSRKQEQATARARQNLEELKRYDAEVARLDAKARRTDGNLAPERRMVATARSSLETAALNPRRSNLTPELLGYQAAIDGYHTRLVGLRSEQATALASARQLNALEISGLTTKNELEAARRVALGNLNSARSQLIGADTQEQKVLLDIIKTEQARLLVIRTEMQALKKLSDAEEATARLARKAEQDRHALAMKNREIEGGFRAQSLTTLPQVQSARLDNGAAIAAARGELATNPSLERQRQLHAEILMLRREGSALGQRENALRAEGNASARQTLEIQRAANAAQVRSLLTTEEVSAAQRINRQQIANLDDIILNGTRKQQREALVLLETEKLRTLELNKQARTVASPPEPKTPGVFGSAGASGVLTRTAGYAAAGAAIYGVVNVMQQGVTASIEFEEGLHKLGAISGATATQTEELGDSILKVARNSRFSAQELTEASTELAQAGYSAQGIQASLKSASDLAVATGSTMAQSVDVMTAAMGAFQLQEQDSSMVANGLVAALNKSRLALPQVALGIQYAGVTAQEQNISFQDLTSAMAAMAQAGVRSGSMMGTGLRQFLTDLASPTQKLSDTLTRLGLSFSDVDVATLGLPQVLQNLSAAGFSASEAYGSMEKRGAAAYLAMQSQLPVFDSVKTAMSDQTAAAVAAAKAADTLAGAWQRAKNNVFADWEEGMAPVNNWLKDLLNDSYGPKSEEMAALLQQQAKETAALTRSQEALAVAYLLPIEAMKTYLAITERHHKEQLQLKLIDEEITEVTRRFSEELEIAATSAAKSADAYNAGRGSLESFETSMASAIKRSNGLRDGSKALETETVSLMNRYPELARNVDTASNSYLSLINSMRTARGEMVATNAELAQAMANDQRGFAQISREEVNANLLKIKAHAEWKNLKLEERQAILDFQHGGLGDAKKTAKLSGVAMAQEGDSKGMRILRGYVGQMQKSGGRYLSGTQTATAAAATAEELKARERPSLKAVYDEVGNLNKPGTSEASKQALIKRLEGAIATNQALVSTRSGGEKSKQQGIVDAYTTALHQAEGTLNSMGSFKDPKPPKETSTPNPKQSLAVAKEIAQALGLQVNSAKRPTWIKDEIKGSGVSSQERLYNKWIAEGRPKDNPTAMPGTSAHEKSNALDIQAAPGVSEASLRKAYADRGMQLTKVMKERGHWHVEWNNSSRMTKPGVAGADSLSDARANMSNNQFALKNATRELDNQLSDITKATTSQMLDAGVASAKLAFEDWEKNLREVTQSEIDTKGMGANEASDRLREMEELIKQKKADLSGKLAESIVKQLELQFKAAEAAFTRAMAPSQKATASAQGALEGLDRYGVSKNVPDYVRGLAQDRLNAAKENEIRASLPAMESQLAAITQAQAAAQARLVAETADGAISPDQLDRSAQAVLDLNSKVDELTASIANLQAQSSATDQIDTTLAGNLTQAIQAWQTLHVNTKTYAQLLGEEVSPALDMLQGEFTTFFSDIFSGTTSVIGAFGNMAKAIIRYIQQIVAKMIASKIVEWIASLAMNFFGGGLGSAGSAMGAGSSMLGHFNGGPVLAGSRANGGPIDTGYAGRDSTLYNLAKGEYVVRSAAVRSVGGSFMRDLNNHGARAFSGLGKMATVPPPANQEMSVYVVAPQEKPTLGPKDVIVTMQQELLKDGSTKKLIKHIAQGG